MIKLKENEILTNILKKDLDDFWDDCIYPDNSPTFGNVEKPTTHNLSSIYKKKNKVRTNSHGDISYQQCHNSTFVSSVYEQGQKKMNELMQKYNSDVLVENEEKHEKNKISRSMERTQLLYERGKLKHKMHNIHKEKSEESRFQKEIMECTWRPKLNKLNPKMEKKIKLLTNDTKIFNRNYRIKNKTKYLNTVAREEKEVNENTFNPAVNTNPDLDTVFDNSNTVYSKDGSTFSFINRYHKSRHDETEKMKKLSPDLGKFSKHLWENRYPNNFKWINEKSKIIHQQHLHRELHNFAVPDKQF